MILIYSLIVSLNILMTKCDQTCDCQEIHLLKEMVQNEILERNVLHEIVQKELLERKIESSKLIAKVRRIEATKRSLPVAAKGLEVGLADRIEKMDAKFSDFDVKLNDILNEKSEVKRNLANTVMKGLMVEKKERINFISDSESQMASVKETVANFKAETFKLIEQCVANMTESQDDFRQDFNTKLHDMEIRTDLEIKSVSSDLKNVKQDLLKAHTKVSKLDDALITNKKAQKVAFTAYGIQAVQGYGLFTFPYVLDNYGSGYSSTTGKFTCTIPGIYHFVATLSIRRRKDHKVIDCFVYVNSVQKIEIFAKKEFDSELTFPSTAAGTFHLNKGDTVCVRDCEEYEDISNSRSTSFTGFLVAAD